MAVQYSVATKEKTYVCDTPEEAAELLCKLLKAGFSVMVQRVEPITLH